MKRPVPEQLLAFESLFLCGEGAPSPEDKSHTLARLRENPETAAMVDALLLERLGNQQLGLMEARKVQRKMEGLLEKFSSPPWFHGTFIAPMETAQGPRAYVQHGNMRRIVTLHPEVKLDTLAAGDDVYLARELNVLLGKEIGRAHV